MAWSADFLTALEQRRRGLRYVLEVLEVYQEPGSSYSIGSHPGLGEDTCLGIRGVSVQGQTLSPRSWSTTVGAWSVTIVGEIQTLCQHMTRGTIVRLLAGFEGMALADFQTIAVGQVRNLRGRPPSWTLEVLDLYSACRQRLLTSGYGLWPIFSDLGSNTTITGTDYAAGDGSLEVVSTAAFKRETGGSGILLVTPSGGGTAFYLTYTGTATGPNRFTGCSATGQLGTTAIAALIGSTITEAAYLSGHPINIVRKIMCSRETSNGSYDVYPAQWGLGILDELVDHDDCDRWRDDVVKVSSGSYTWQIGQLEEADDAFSWLSALLSPAGIFLSARQGLLTVRAGQDTQSPLWHSGIEITDADIEEIEDWEGWDPNHSPEYATIAVAGDTALISPSSPTSAATLPADSSLRFDLSASVFSNETAICTEVRDRVVESATRVPERIVARCAGLRLAQLGIGDLIDLTTLRAHSRRDGAEGYDGRVCEVDELSTDWDGGTVRVGLLCYPDSDDVFA